MAKEQPESRLSGTNHAYGAGIKPSSPKGVRAKRLDLAEIGMKHLKSKRNSRKVFDPPGTALAKQVACTAPQEVPIRHNRAKPTLSGRFGRSEPMMNVLRRALVAANIAFSTKMAVADGLQDGLTAAQAGDAIAQSNLGVMYFKGSGVPPDIVTAHMWLNIANANGSEPAAGMRARLERQMTPAEISVASRRAKLCMASSYADCD